MNSRIYFIYLLLLSVIFIGCNQNPEAKVDNDEPEQKRELTEEELKEQLYITECENGTKYLKGKINYDPRYKGLLSIKVTGLKINCTVTNSATLATLKDVEIQIKFKSKTGAIIKEDSFVIYEFIKPGATVTYKTELECTNQQYKDIVSFDSGIVRASCKR